MIKPLKDPIKSNHEKLVGGIPTPPEKYEFVRLDHPNYWGFNKTHIPNHQSLQ